MREKNLVPPLPIAKKSVPRGLQILNGVMTMDGAIGDFIEKTLILVISLTV